MVKHRICLSRLALAAAVAALTGTLLSACGASRTADHTTTVVQTVTRPKTESSLPVKRAAPAVQLVGYQGSSYTVRVPAGWVLAEDETAHEGFVETKWRDPQDPNTSITIDAAADQSTSPADKAAEVRAAVAGEPSYSEEAFTAATVGPYPGHKWVFHLSGDKRVDYFVNDCTTGVAILGSTSPEGFAKVRATFDRVAGSVSIDCAPPPPPPPGTNTDTNTDEADFCSTHSCIPSFDEGAGYIVQCNDGMWSHSGGRPGACSHHDGESGTTWP